MMTFFVLYALYLVTLYHQILKATFGCKPNIFWYITVISVKNSKPNLTKMISMKKTNEKNRSIGAEKLYTKTSAC